MMREDASDFGNTEVDPNLGVSFAVKDEKDVSDHELENDTREPVSLQRDEDTYYYSTHTGTGQSPKKGNKKDVVGALGSEQVIHMVGGTIHWTSTQTNYPCFQPKVFFILILKPNTSLFSLSSLDVQTMA
ncbi:hypothetical protein LR48_Vigan02g129400 [Vigna angularis]|uniref:Uncharacterized protein n=1 Tax=Phaseolus angularis TaxID=3914 RepID=A0A0L9TY77_PHAAN|nr:hypothetical protein LR48_Vigan02g129400 [Vigna angularis]